MTIAEEHLMEQIATIIDNYYGTVLERRLFALCQALIAEEREVCAATALNAGHNLAKAVAEGKASVWGIHRGIAEAIRARAADGEVESASPPSSPS